MKPDFAFDFWQQITTKTKA